MRQLNEHKINPGNDTLTITVLDEPGHGGAASKARTRFDSGAVIGSVW